MRVIIAALVTAASLVSGPGAADASSPADTNLARAVASGATVPAAYLAASGGIDVLASSDALSAEEIRSITETLQPGYATGGVVRRGAHVLTVAVYWNSMAPDKVIAVVYESWLRPASGADTVVVAAVAAERTGSTAWRGTAAGADGSTAPVEFESAGPFECAAAVIAFLGLTGLCAASVIPSGGATALCAVAAAEAGMSAGLICTDEPDPMTATIAPKTQSVRGNNHSTDYDLAEFYLTGSQDIPADRSVYNTRWSGCSACPSRPYVYNSVGTSYHYWATTTCGNGTTGTVYGYVYYDTGSRYDTAQVTIVNQYC